MSRVGKKGPQDPSGESLQPTDSIHQWTRAKASGPKKGDYLAPQRMNKMTFLASGYMVPGTAPKATSGDFDWSHQPPNKKDAKEVTEVALGYLHKMFE